MAAKVIDEANSANFAAALNQILESTPDETVGLFWCLYRSRRIRY